MSNIAIRVEDLSKLYHIGKAQQRHDTLRDALVDGWRSSTRWLQRMSNRKLGIANSHSEDLWALKDVSFEVKRGEVLGIIGRNGAGKSTLLKILSRITEPTEGRAIMHGRVGSLLEVGTGFHPELTGRENIYLNGAILGMKRTEIERRFDEIVAFAEIDRFLDTPVKRYSSGMYVRLAFAVAAHLEPEILIVDEVLAVGDMSFQAKCLNKMQDVSQIGRTVLFVSHSMRAIHDLCSRTLLFTQGRITIEGPTNCVIEAYASQGMIECPEYILPYDPEKPIHLRRICLTTFDGRPASEFRYDQGLHIVIEYEVNRSITDCSVWLDVRTVEEVIAFGTSDSSANKSLLGRREPGYYRTVVELPAKWLNAGRYYLVVGIVRSASVSLDRVEASAFTVLDIGAPEKGRKGVLQPFLEWNTSTLRAAA